MQAQGRFILRFYTVYLHDVNTSIIIGWQIDRDFLHNADMQPIDEQVWSVNSSYRRTKRVPMRILFALLLVGLSLAVSANGSGNLLVNASFTGSYQGWGNPYILPPDPRRLDYSRDIGSGSVELIAWRPIGGGRYIVLTQCVNIEPETSLEYGASVYVPAHETEGNTRGLVNLNAFTQPECRVDTRSRSEFPSVATEGAGEYWQKLRGRFDAGPDIRSVEVLLLVSKDEGVAEPRSVFADDVYLRQIAETDRTPPPNTGLWWNPTRPGSGVTIDRQGDMVTAAVYGFDQNGQAQWLVGSGQLQDSVVVAPLFSATDGACFNCPFQSPELTAQQVATFEFTSSDSARMRLGLEPAVPIRSFWFATDTIELGEVDPQLGAPLLPDLSGRWVFASPHDNEQSTFVQIYDVACCFDPPAEASPSIVLTMTFTQVETGEELQLACIDDDDTIAVPFCALVDDPAIPVDLWQPIFSFHARDIGINRITASSDGPVRAAENVIRGSRTIYGYRIP